MNPTTSITNDEIGKLRLEADVAGDLLMAAICCRALGDDLSGAEPGTPGAEARAMTVEKARAECARVIEEARGQQ